MERHSNKTPCCCCGCRQMGRHGTTVETAIDSNLPQAQASEDHAHVRMSVWTWLAVPRAHHWTGMLAALIDGDITPLDDAVCSRLHATHAARREPWMRGWTYAVAASTASCQALPFPMLPAWDQGDTRATPKIVPILLIIQHNRVTMTSDPTTPLPSLKRSWSACRRACAAFETRYSME